MFTRIFLPLSALLFAFSCLAGAPAIGTADTGPILDGARFQTSSSARQIELNSGVNLRLSPRSSGTLFGDHIVLDEGSVRVENFDGYSVQARQLAIGAADSRTQAVVRIGSKNIEVASLGGVLNVVDGGALLTRVASGTHLSFQQSGASAGQTGAAPAKKRLPSDQHVMVWLIGITGAAAITIGAIAASQGKSPF